MRKLEKITGPLSAVALLAAATLRAVPEDAEPDENAIAENITVLARTVQTDTAMTCRRYPARIRAVEQVDVVSRLSADIEEIGFDEGGTVRKGQLLYRLDDTRFVAAVSNQTAQIAETCG